MWLESPLQELTYEGVMSNLETPFNSEGVLCARIHAYLERHGYINFGIFKRVKVNISSFFHAVPAFFF